MSKTSKIILAIIVVVIAAAVIAAVCYAVGQNSKGIMFTVEVTHGDGTTKSFEVKTNAENLADALVQEGIIEGHEDTYGLYIDIVDGEAADAKDNQAWVFTKNGEEVATGAASTPIADGEHYEFYILKW